MLHIRPACWAQDEGALSTLDTSFVADRVYRLTQDGLTFRLVEETITPPLRKSYPFDPFDAEGRAEWDHAVVAEDGGRIVGFAAAQYTAWNRRATVWHLYVAPNCRGRSVGTRLLESLDCFAREAGARCLWLETQNVNVPAMRFYFRMGFTLCGFDASLYDSDGPAQGEVALFMIRPIFA